MHWAFVCVVAQRIAKNDVRHACFGCAALKVCLIIDKMALHKDEVGLFLLLEGH